MTVVTDPQVRPQVEQADGWTTPAKIVSGGLVAIPFTHDQWLSEGGSGFSANPVLTNLPGTVGLNSDGSCSGLVAQIPQWLPNTSPGPANPAAAGGILHSMVYGRKIGIRWRYDSSPLAPAPFDLKIDGISYAVNPVYNNYLIAEGSDYRGEGWALVADDLPDGRHYVDICMTGDPAAAHNYVFLGWLLDPAWYTPLPHTNFIGATGPVYGPTAGTVNNPVTGPGVSGQGLVFNPGLVAAIQYHNATDTLAAPVVVKLTITMGGLIVTRATIVPGDTYVFTPPGGAIPLAGTSIGFLHYHDQTCTSSTSITSPGSQTVTLINGPLKGSFGVGSTVVVGTGGNVESVVATAVTDDGTHITSFTAVFQFSHTGTYQVTWSALNATVYGRN